MVGACRHAGALWARVRMLEICLGTDAGQKVREEADGLPRSCGKRTALRSCRCGWLPRGAFFSSQGRQSHLPHSGSASQRYTAKIPPLGQVVGWRLSTEVMKTHYMRKRLLPTSASARAQCRTPCHFFRFPVHPQRSLTPVAASWGWGSIGVEGRKGLNVRVRPHLLRRS